MNDFASMMPVHRSMFGTSITNALVCEAMSNDDLRCNYVTFLITDCNFQKVVYAHYDRLPGRNFGDLMDGLDSEMMEALSTIPKEDEVIDKATEEDPFPMFDATPPTGESVDGE